MSASDFDAALKFVKGRAAGAIPKPSRGSGMGYADWAHRMIVAWRVLYDEWEKTNQKGPEPNFLLCPECEVMMLLDTMQGDVLICPGGCHRAITVNTFVSLFKAPAKAPRHVTPSPSSSLNSSGFSSSRVATQPRKAALNTTVPKGAKPEDYGVTEGVQRSKKAMVGWRMWNVYPPMNNKLREPFKLYSLSYGGPWPSMAPQIGTCHNADPSEITDHKCPSWEHRCGVHAVKSTSQLRKWGNPDVGPNSEYARVTGEVEMWGRVLEYEEGFRAEWAYPLKLYLPTDIPSTFEMTAEELGEKLWETYLVEVVVDNAIFANI